MTTNSDGRHMAVCGARCMPLATLITALAICSSSTALAQTVALPDNIVDRAPVAIAITDLPPGATATITAVRNEASGRRYRSQAVFLVAADGGIDLATAVPVSGDYAGADAAGLFWSMKPDAADPAAVPQAAIVTVEASVGGQMVASDSAPLLLRTPAVEIVDVPDFPAARLYRQPGSDRLPLIILLGGSEGGRSAADRFGPVLAAQGYAVIGLPYYWTDWGGDGPNPGLPSAFADIPVDRIAAVRDWAQRQPGIAADRIGIYGVSKGAEFALLAAATYPWLSAVAAIVPSDVVWEGWGDGGEEDSRSSFALDGRPLAFVPYRGMRAAIAALSRGEGGSVGVPHEEGRRAAPARAAAARIPIERYRGALLVAGGDRDSTWPSGIMTRTIAERRAEAGLATIALTYRNAGHGLSGTGWEPSNGPGQVDGAANAVARREIHAAVLSMFASALKR